MIKKILTTAIAAATLAATSIFGIQSAEAKSGDLIIRNASNSTASLLVCQNWTGSKCAGTWYYLWPGKNTRDYFGWQDADAVKLVPSQKYYVSTNNWSVHNSCGGATVMEKRPGSAVSSTVETWTVYYC